MQKKQYEIILSKVDKPSRYINHEINSQCGIFDDSK